jgi:hypothetical protein
MWTGGESVPGPVGQPGLVDEQRDGHLRACSCHNWKPGYETPGTFKVMWTDIDHKSSEFNNAPMPYSVFNGGIAFHRGSLREQSHVVCIFPNPRPRSSSMPSSPITENGLVLA